MATPSPPVIREFCNDLKSSDMQKKWLLLTLPLNNRHTCQLYPINSESPYFGRHSHSPSLFCQKWPNLLILRAVPYLWLKFFKIFPLNHIKFPNISHIEIVITSGAHRFAGKVHWKWSFSRFLPHEIFKRLTGMNRNVSKRCGDNGK